MNLAARGERDGARELPASDSSQPSDAETAIVTRIKSELAGRSKRLLGVSNAGDFGALPQELETLAGEPQTILTQFRGKKARAQSAAQVELDNAHTDYERASHGYQQFRRRHGLINVEPRYDTVFWRKIFWLTLLFSIEVAANGWVIGQASPGGLVQGWTTALFISVLVVLTGTLIGMGPWRYLSYSGIDGRGRLHLLWAAPAVLVGVIAITFFALYVAHYRWALSASDLDAPVPDQLLSSILSAPFAPFEQLDSLILFVVAMLIGVFSIVRGYHWNDPYPGFGGLHQKMMGERERAQRIAQQLATEIDQARAAATAEFTEISAKAQQSVGALQDALARARENGAEWDRQAGALIAIGREAIEIYRTANRSKRNTPAPRHFSQDPFESVKPVASAALIAALETALPKAVSTNIQFKSQLAGARAQLETEYKAFYSDELTPFLKTISNTATARVRDEIEIDMAQTSGSAPKADGDEAKILRPRRFGSA
jgi:DNA-binding ferritin-like protein